MLSSRASSESNKKTVGNEPIGRGKVLGNGPVTAKDKVNNIMVNGKDSSKKGHGNGTLSRQSSMETTSDATSTASAISDDIIPSLGNNRVRSRRSCSRRSVDSEAAALAGATDVCNMCDSEPSEFICVQCGRLSFCTKCCLMLHDNKFLGTHVLLSLDVSTEGKKWTLQNIKDKSKNSSQSVKRVAAVSKSNSNIRDDIRDNITTPGETVKGSVESSASTVTIDKGNVNAIPIRVSMVTQKTENLKEDDLSVFTADRSVILARVKELQASLTQGRELQKEISKERTMSKAAAKTAVDAVRHNFDILRSLLKTKEDEFVAVVEAAGKSRVEKATTSAGTMAISNAELDGFIDHLTLLLDELEENKSQFFQNRTNLLETTSAKLTEVDGWIHERQTELEEIRALCLGVHVPVEKIAQAIHELRAPAYLTHRQHDVTRKPALNSSAFAHNNLNGGNQHYDVLVPISPNHKSPHRTPLRQMGPSTSGVQSRRFMPDTLSLQIATQRNQQGATINASHKDLAGRKLYTHEIKHLQLTPMKNVLNRTNSPIERRMDPLSNLSTNATTSLINESSIISPYRHNNIMSRGVAHNTASPLTPRGLISRNITTPTKQSIFYTRGTSSILTGYTNETNISSLQRTASSPLAGGDSGNRHLRKIQQCHTPKRSLTPTRASGGSPVRPSAAFLATGRDGVTVERSTTSISNITFRSSPSAFRGRINSGGSSPISRPLGAPVPFGSAVKRGSPRSVAMMHSPIPK
eukprot:Tbor_TRINITY_DN4741_c0_g1::TRINITY_DN4741_c0_g1_i1::g.16991::m.16991